MAQQGRSEVSKSLRLRLLLPPVFVLEPPISRAGDEGGPRCSAYRPGPRVEKGSACLQGPAMCPLQVRM